MSIMGDTQECVNTAEPTAAVGNEQDTLNGSVLASGPVEGATSKETDGMPAIAAWKTSPGFAILGYLASFFVVWMFLVTVFSLVITLLFWDARGSFYAGEYGSLAGVPALMVTSVLRILYAVLFYRSYFTERPCFRSSRVISFCNLLFGGVIFGCCWNANMTKSRLHGRPEMGSAHWGAVILASIAIAYASFLMAYDVFPTLLTKASYPQYSAASSSSASHGSASVWTIPGTGTQIAIPSNWSCQVDDRVLVLKPNYGGEYSGVIVAASDMSEYFTKKYLEENGGQFDISSVSEEVFLERNRSEMDSVESEEAHLVVIDGVRYWKVRTVGTYLGAPMRNTSLYGAFGLVVYQFALSSCGESDDTDERLFGDYSSIIESVQYE